MSAVVSCFRKADPEMSSRPAKHFILQIIEEKALAETEKVNLPRFKAAVRTGPLHRFTPFSANPATLKVLSPTVKKKKKTHVNCYVEQFTATVRRDGCCGYHSLEPPTNFSGSPTTLNSTALRVEEIAREVMGVQ